MPQAEVDPGVLKVCFGGEVYQDVTNRRPGISIGGPTHSLQGWKESSHILYVLVFTKAAIAYPP